MSADPPMFGDVYILVSQWGENRTVENAAGGLTMRPSEYAPTVPNVCGTPDEIVSWAEGLIVDALKHRNDTEPPRTTPSMSSTHFLPVGCEHGRRESVDCAECDAP